MNRKRWNELMGTFGIDVSTKIDMYAKLRRLYRQKHRHYHNFNHIKACLDKLDEVFYFLDRPFEVELALWLHDAVYDTTKNDNEVQSAFMAESFLQSHNVKTKVIDRIWDLIMVTYDHSQCETNDEAFLIDIDLSILGQSEEEYSEYDKQIKEEYKWVHPDVYNRERKRILTKFSNMKHIYQTKYFRDKYEAQARINLQNSINELK